MMLPKHLCDLFILNICKHSYNYRVDARIPCSPVCTELNCRSRKHKETIGRPKEEEKISQNWKATLRCRKGINLYFRLLPQPS